MSANLRFEPITVDNYRAVCELPMAEHQRYWVAPNAYSIIESLLSPTSLFTYALYVGDAPVGLVMCGVDVEKSPPEHWIVRLMIAEPHQRKGYGRAALRRAVDMLGVMPGCTAVHISFLPDNAPACALYISEGFVDTGQVDEGEVIYRLEVQNR